MATRRTRRLAAALLFMTAAAGSGCSSPDPTVRILSDPPDATVYIDG
jgi:hypothetical protein